MRTGPDAASSATRPPECETHGKRDGRRPTPRGGWSWSPHFYISPCGSRLGGYNVPNDENVSLVPTIVPHGEPVFDTRSLPTPGRTPTLMRHWLGDVTPTRVRLGGPSEWRGQQRPDPRHRAPAMGRCLGGAQGDRTNDPRCHRIRPRLWGAGARDG